MDINYTYVIIAVVVIVVVSIQYTLNKILATLKDIHKDLKLLKNLPK